jgi:anti-anti-sigma factor
MCSGTNVTARRTEKVLIFEVSARREGPRLVLEPRGELDLATAPRLERVLADALATEAVAEITVDLAGVDFLDLSGLRALCSCARLARDRGAAFALSSVPRQSRMLFELWRRSDV